MKLIGLMAIASVVSFTSCKKESVNTLDPMSAEITSEEPNFILANAGYQTEVTNELLSENGEEYYSEGSIEYRSGSEILAVVNFNPNSNIKATLIKNGVSSEFDLKKKKTFSKYKKVIVKPLVKTNDCKYIVEGIIKYYDSKTGSYLATIDYGSGTCDEWATKTWAAGSEGGKSWPAGSDTFSLDKSKKGGEK